MVDIVSKKLAEVLDVEDNINGEQEVDKISTNPLTNQPVYGSSLITEADVEAFESVEAGIGLENFSKIVLMKTAQKASNDHDELIDIMAKVDDSKAARMAEVAVAALSASADAAKALMQFSLQKEKMAIEKQKLEIKSVTINNLNAGGEGGMQGTHKEIMDRIKDMMENEDEGDEPPPLIDVT